MSPLNFNSNILTPGQAYVIGVGRSGIAAAKVLKKKGWQVILSDSNENPTLQKQAQELAQEGIEVRLKHSFNLEDQEKPDLIVVSPGVPWDAAILEKARKKEIEIMGEIELAYRYLSNVPWIGITGTNGKTTTTALIAAIFQAAGLNAPACGNIGYAACELVLNPTQPLDWVIAEISSFQIESSSTLSPQIGVWTTFTPDHLNRHKTMENYYRIKASLLERSRSKVFNGDDAYLAQVGVVDWSSAHWTSTKGREGLGSQLLAEVYLEDLGIMAFGELIMPINLFKMQGNHNWQNLLLAIAVARLAKIDTAAIVEAITNFSGVVHRLEKICTIDGLDYINDSKATNYDAAQVGLSAVTGPVILIAGGQAKEGDDLAWLETIKEKVSSVLLIGQASTLFAERLEALDYLNYEKVETMEKAVLRSLELGKEQKAKVVLLSPACASFDQYKSFEERGDHFRYLAQQLAMSNDILKDG